MKDSDEIITEPEDVKKRWTNYFSNLLNVDTQGNDEIGESRLEDTLNIEEFTEDEVKTAVDRSRNGKAPGCDIIPNEIYKTGNKAMICRLAKLCNYRDISLTCYVAKLHDIISALRQLIEKHWDFNKPLYVAFLDLKKNIRQDTERKRMAGTEQLEQLRALIRCARV